MLENLPIKKFNEWVEKNNWLEVGKKNWEELVDIKDSSAVSDFEFHKNIDEIIYLLPDGRTANVCFEGDKVISISIPNTLQIVKFRGLIL